MAEIIQTSNKKKAGVQRIKKAALKVDLTPMVDLGFMLISFFVFTNTLAHPKVLGLNLPDDKHIIDSSKTPVSKTLNILPSGINKTYYYEGDDVSNIKSTDNNTNALQAIILAKKQQLENRFGEDSDLTVLIKPIATATYQNVVHAFNEMQVCTIKTYVLMDASNKEISLLH